MPGLRSEAEMTRTYTVKVIGLDLPDADFVIMTIVKAGFKPKVEQDGIKG